MISSQEVVAMRVVTHRMVASVTAMLKKSRSRQTSLARSSRVSAPQLLII